MVVVTYCVETESICSSDILDTICDRGVDGLGGGFLFFWFLAWLAIIFFLVVHRSKKGWEVVSFKLCGIIPHGCLSWKEVFTCGQPIDVDAGEEPWWVLHQSVHVLRTSRSISVLPILYSSWTNWCLGRHTRRTYTPVLLYTGLVCKGYWDGGAPLSPLFVGEYTYSPSPVT